MNGTIELSSEMLQLRILELRLMRGVWDTIFGIVENWYVQWRFETINLQFFLLFRSFAYHRQANDKHA